MKKNIFIVAAIIIIIIIGGWLIFSNKESQSVPQNETEISQQSQENLKEKINLIIDSSEGDLKTFEVEFNEGMTAFDLLKQETEKLGLTLKAKSYDMGVFIEAIGNREGGEDGKYWLYYVNGEMPQVAADKQEIKAGDKVEFKFEKSPF